MMKRVSDFLQDMANKTCGMEQGTHSIGQTS
jgi:hypothetical protein